MNFKIYYCTHKRINFLQIISEEVINRKLEAEKVEKSDFVKYLQKDNPKGFNDFLAVSYNSAIHHNIDFKSLSYDGLLKEEVSKLNSYLKNLTFDKVNFMNSNIQTEYFSNLFKVKSLNINGKCNGIIDLKKFKQLENISILRWNSKIKIINKNDSLKKLIVWYFNPKSRNLKELLNETLGIEYLELNLTNIETLEGIEKLTKLKILKINYGRNLKLVDSLNMITQTELIFFNNCKKIENIDLLNSRINLEVMNVKLPG